MWSNLSRAAQGVSRKSTYFERLGLNAGSVHTFFIEESLLSFLEGSLPLLSGMVLDVGCGSMKYKPIVLQGKEVKQYIGLDLEEGKYGHFYKPDLEWDGNAIPLADNSVDSAMLFEVLEHCERPGAVIAEIARVLKPRGVLLFTTPFFHPLHGMPFDFQRFSPPGLHRLLADAGFSDVHIELSGSWDASLAQMLGMWVVLRPMPELLRKVLRKLAVLPVGLLFTLGKKHSRQATEDTIAPSILGHARKAQTAG